MNAAWLRLPESLRKGIAARHGLQKMIGNTGWVMADQVVRMGVGLLVGVWLARYLGPEQYGQFSYAAAFATIFAPLATLGLHDVLVRDFAREPFCRDQILGSAFPLMAAGGVAVFTLTLVGIFLTRTADTLSHWLVGIAMAGALFQAFSAIECWFSARLEARFWVYARVGAFLVTSMVKAVMILMRAPLVAFAWAGLAELVLGSVLLVLVYRGQRLRLTAWRFDGATAVRLLREGWPLMFAVLLNMAYQRIDQVMLGDLAGSRELGVYSAAVRISELWVFLPAAICASVFPAIVEAGTVNEALFLDRLQKLYNLMALIAYMVAVPITIFSDRLVQLLYGPAYQKSGPLLAVLVWAGIFISLGAAQTLYLVSRNWTRVYLICMLLGCLVNVALNCFLIPRYGAMGAVFSSCISYWFAVHGTCLLFKPLRQSGIMLTKALIYPKVW